MVEEESTLIDEMPRTLRSEVRVASESGETPRTPTLTMVAGPRRGCFVCIELGARAIFIGRDELSDFPIDDPSVSRRHARVYLDQGTEGGSSVVLQDLGSTNGTLVNRQAVSRRVLRHGDRVHVGDVLLRFEMLDPVDMAYRDGVAQKVLEGEQDPLTNLLTRAAMDHHLPELMEQCAQQGRPLSAVMMDLDHFKKVNDSLGHAAGDEVLKATAARVREEIRRDDLAIRYGGEEFLLILAGARRLHARLLAERLREKVAGHRLPTLPDLQVTCSLGVAERAPGEPLEAWLDRADKALYRAKNGGRNRSEAAPGPQKTD